MVEACLASFPFFPWSSLAFLFSHSPVLLSLPWFSHVWALPIYTSMFSGLPSLVLFSSSSLITFSRVAWRELLDDDADTLLPLVLNTLVLNTLLVLTWGRISATMYYKLQKWPIWQKLFHNRYVSVVLPVLGSSGGAVWLSFSSLADLPFSATQWTQTKVIQGWSLSDGTVKLWWDISCMTGAMIKLPR